MNRIKTNHVTMSLMLLLCAGVGALVAGGSAAAGRSSTTPPGPAGQRSEMIAELRTLNAQVAELLDLQRKAQADEARCFASQQEQLRRLERAVTEVFVGQPSMVPLREAVAELQRLNGVADRSLNMHEQMAALGSQWHAEFRQELEERDKVLQSLIEKGRVKVTVAPEKKPERKPE